MCGMAGCIGAHQQEGKDDGVVSVRNSRGSVGEAEGCQTECGIVQVVPEWRSERHIASDGTLRITGGKILAGVIVCDVCPCGYSRQGEKGEGDQRTHRPFWAKPL